MTTPGGAAGGKGVWGFNLQHKVILTIFHAVTCLPLNGKEKFSNGRDFEEQREEKLCQAGHLGQVGVMGLGRRGVSRGLGNAGLREFGNWVLLG